MRTNCFLCETLENRKYCVALNFCGFKASFHKIKYRIFFPAKITPLYKLYTKYWFEENLP